MHIIKVNQQTVTGAGLAVAAACQHRSAQWAACSLIEGFSDITGVLELVIIKRMLTGKIHVAATVRLQSCAVTTPSPFPPLLHPLHQLPHLLLFIRSLGSRRLHQACSFGFGLVIIRYAHTAPVSLPLRCLFYCELPHTQFFKRPVQSVHPKLRQ